MAAIEAGLFSKFLAFISSPLTQLAGSAIEIGGKKLTDKVTALFETGEASLGDEILTDNTLSKLKNIVLCKNFEDFMTWLETQPDGKRKGEKVREVIVKKITSKEIKTGGGKDNSKPVVVYTDHNYDLATEFVSRMMSQGDNNAILSWLTGKGFFSTITAKKISIADKALLAVKNDANNAASETIRSIDKLTAWIKSKHR